MKDTLQIKFANGHKFNVPVSVVARHRGEYYKSINNDMEWHDLIKESSLPKIAVEWLKEKMEWSDVQLYATRADYVEPDYDELFNTAKFKTV